MSNTNPVSKLSCFNLLGVNVSTINMTMALKTFDHWIDCKQAHYVCVTPVHSIMMCRDDIHLRKIYNRAGMVTPDGMPVVWMGKRQGNEHMGRVYGPDLMLALCDHSQSCEYRHFFYGGSEEVVKEMVDKFSQQFPDLQIAGYYSPPFRELTLEEDTQISEIINAASPHFVWIGLGAPKQEYWMEQHLEKLAPAILIGVGAAFDFHAGHKPQAPIWMQRNGLEWLFRFASEPRRLWKRYLINNPRFIFHSFMQLTGLRKYPIET